MRDDELRGPDASRLHRRAFLRWLGIGAGAVAAAPLLALVPTPATVAAPALRDAATGISIRFIKQWDIAKVTRYDVLYGFVPPKTLAARVVG